MIPRSPRWKLDRTLAVASVDMAANGVILDLSEGGLAVRGNVQAPSYEPIMVEIQLPGSHEYILATGMVSWTRGGETGIRFLCLPEVARQRLKDSLLNLSLVRTLQLERRKQAQSGGPMAQPVPEFELDKALEVENPAVSAEMLRERLATARRARLTRSIRETGLIFAATTIFGGVFLGVVQIELALALMLAAGMSVPVLFLAIYHVLQHFARKDEKPDNKPTLTAPELAEPAALPEATPQPALAMASHMQDAQGTIQTLNLN
ncbi:MAG TPA: PilZ domain-containing protein [Terriglobales bacterium]|nr:PilZ domain-containing protein [Terriglobales bacterium]